MLSMTRQRKYVYPSLFFIVLLFLMLVRMAAALEGPGMTPALSGELEGWNSTLHTARAHSEEDLLNAVYEFNAAFNPQTESDRETQDIMLLAAREERVRAIKNRWRRANGDFFTWVSGETGHGTRNYSATHGDKRYGEERNRLDDLRYLNLQQYRNQREQILEEMRTMEKNSREHAQLSRQLDYLDLEHIRREGEYEKEYRNLDLSFSLRSH